MESPNRNLDIFPQFILTQTPIFKISTFMLYFYNYEYMKLIICTHLALKTDQTSASPQFDLKMGKIQK